MYFNMFKIRMFQKCILIPFLNTHFQQFVLAIGKDPLLCLMSQKKKKLSLSKKILNFIISLLL